MKFTLSWLKDHLDTTATLEQIVAKLVDIGIEVEGIIDPSEKYKGFVVAQIISLERHPNADRLNICQVDVGQEKLAQIVCGAPNVRPGMKVVFAHIGTVIPNSGMTLKQGEIRGVESQGMMCSERELEFGDNHSGLIDLEVDAPIGTPLKEALHLDDPVIDVAITPNRADCFSVRGIARDLAATGIGKLKPLTVKNTANAFQSSITVTLDDQKACPEFLGREIRGVRNGPSPEWLQRRLKAVGLRPISALVDITNYLSIDIGRPMHVYDAKTLDGGIKVRLSRENDKLKALDGKEYILDNQTIVIADNSGVIGLGGIMGGESTSCTENTTNVFLESALFDAVTITLSGQKLKILSDARTRFERGVDTALVEVGIDLATQYILEWCGGSASQIVYAGQEIKSTEKINLTERKLHRLSGTEMSLPEAEDILLKLGFQKGNVPAKTLDASREMSFTVPTWRHDIFSAEDLIEEVLRIKGYDKLPAYTLPLITQGFDRDNPKRRLRMAFAARGLNEAVTWSFMDEATARLFGEINDTLKLANPISQDLDAMRPSILPNLIASASNNADHGQHNGALFEVGPQYSFAKEGLPHQHLMAAGIRTQKAGPRHWASPLRPIDVFDAKADLIAGLEQLGVTEGSYTIETTGLPSYYHPGRSGVLLQGRKIIGYFGEVHPKILKAMDVVGPIAAFEIFMNAVPPRKIKTSRPALELSPFPMVERDFAFVLDQDITTARVIHAIERIAPKEQTFPAKLAAISGIDIFDEYRGEHVVKGKKSLAVAVKITPIKETLNEESITAVTTTIIHAVFKATGGTLRQ